MDESKIELMAGMRQCIKTIAQLLADLQIAFEALQEIIDDEGK